MSPAAGVTLRAAGTDDLAAITAIYANHVRHGTGSFEIEPPDEQEMRRRWDQVKARGLPYLAACRAEAVVGYAYADVYRPRPAYRFTVEDSIYVRADCAGRGIGRALLAALINACQREGARQMIAVIGDAANTGSIRMHEGAGFTRAGLLQGAGWKFGRWLDVVLMQRALGPGNSRPG